MLQPAINYIGIAVRFYKKQPLLNSVVGVFLVLPYVIASGFDMGMESFGGMIQSIFNMSPMQLQAMYLVVQLLLTLWIIWGIAGVIHIGTRLVKSAAGRTKTSLQSVTSQSRKHILPFFFTGLIRDCITLILLLPYFAIVFVYLLNKSPEELNAFIVVMREIVLMQSQTAQLDPAIGTVMLLLLPLLVPAAYYRITTSLYQMVIVHEKIEYRAALKKSSTYIRKQFWSSTLKMLIISLCTFIPVSICIGIADAGITMFDERLAPLVPLISGIGLAFATAIFSLALLALYKDMLPKTTSKKAVKRTTKTVKKTTKTTAKRS